MEMPLTPLDFAPAACAPALRGSEKQSSIREVSRTDIRTVLRTLQPLVIGAFQSFFF